MALNLHVLQSNYEEKLDKVVYEYDLKMVEDKFSIQTLSNEFNDANNTKEKLCQRVVAAEIACVEKEVEEGKLHHEIAAFAAAFNEKLAMQALKLVAHFDRKLDVELDAEKNYRHLAALSGA